MPRLLRWALCLLLLAGCRSKPVRYDLDPVPPDEPEPEVAVQVADLRPKWERRYLDGSVRDVHYDLAITFIPAESFTPSPFAHLEAQVRRQLQQLPDPPCEASVLVRSFRVVHNDVDRLEALHEASEEERKRKEEEQDRQDRLLGLKEAEEETSLGGSIFAFACEGVFAGLWGAWWGVQTGLRGQLQEEYGPDVTCDVRALVTLRWADGRQKEMSVRAIVNSGTAPAGMAGCYIGSDVEHIVPAAIDDFARQLVNKAN